MLRVDIAEKFDLIHEYYSPKVAGEINDMQVKLVKLRGEFMWHHHDHEDELFVVFGGTLRMKYRTQGAEREELIGPGQFIIIPHGMEHFPSSAHPDEEVTMMLLEPKSTLNTGNLRNERTVAQLERI